MKMRKDQRVSKGRIEKLAVVPAEITVTPTVAVSAPGRDRLATKGQ